MRSSEGLEAKTGKGSAIREALAVVETRIWMTDIRGDLLFALFTGVVWTETFTLGMASFHFALS